jgi:hypothetical protein
MEVAKLLQAERSRGGSSAVVSNVFALELAYILENFGGDGVDETRLILDLYLKGCESLMLAVSYAQRTPARSEALWESLIDYCLSDDNQKSTHRSPAQSSRKGPAKAIKADGSLFGSLLEAAALSGADLAHLVQQIPPGMSIEGLRPRLVSAVADSRFKVRMRQLTREIAVRESRMLARELEHRSRRGSRYGNSGPVGAGRRPVRTAPAPGPKELPASVPLGGGDRGTLVPPPQPRSHPVRLERTAPREDRHRQSFAIPIR